MNKSLVAFPSTISTKYFSNFLGTRDPSCLLSHELCVRSSSLQTPATHRTIDAVHSWVIDEGLPTSWNPWDVHERSVFAFPSATCSFVQALICGSIFSVFNLLISRAAEPHVFNKEENSSLGGLPTRSSGCSRFCTRRSSALSSSRLRSHIVPLALAVVKSTAKPSRSPNLVAHDANFDGLSIAVVSHAFNSWRVYKTP